jgi:hypothetical protein
LETQAWLPVLIGLVVIGVIVLIVVAYGLPALKNIFGMKEKVPEVQFTPYPAVKGLYIKIDPGATPKVRRFHLTNEPTVIIGGGLSGNPDVDCFKIDKKSFESSRCIIFVGKLEESLGSCMSAYTWIYYVEPGSKIQADCSTVGGCLNIIKNNCRTSDENCDNTQPGEFTVSGGFCGRLVRCDIDRATRVINQVFTDSIENECNMENERIYCPAEQCCHLLQGFPDEPKFKIKYGLICDDRGLWRPCTATGLSVTVAGKEYVCEWDEDKGYGKWVEKKFCVKGTIKLGTVCAQCNDQETAWVDNSSLCSGTKVCVNGQCVEGNCVPKIREAEPEYCAVARQCGTEYCCEPVGGQCLTVCKALTKETCDTYCCEWKGSPPPSGCSGTWSCSGLDSTTCGNYPSYCSWQQGCMGGIAPNPECRGAKCTELPQSSCTICGCTLGATCVGSGSCSGLDENTCKSLFSLGCKWT